MTPRRRADSGQAFPIYLWMVASLLFVVLVFLAAGQAGDLRNSAQGAADAAALGGAQAMRDTPPWGDGDPGDLEWEDVIEFFRGGLFRPDRACDGAGEFASRNEASVQRCEVVDFAVQVEVQSNRSAKNPAVPGLGAQRAKARARAVIEPRDCSVGPKPEVPTDPLVIDCGGKIVEVSPLDPDVGELWKDLVRTLFAVKLVD
jgi:hypothetical protein